MPSPSQVRTLNRGAADGYYDRYAVTGTVLNIATIGSQAGSNAPIADQNGNLNVLGDVSGDTFTYGGVTYTYFGTVGLGAIPILGPLLGSGFIGEAPDGSLSLFLPNGRPSLAGLTGLTLGVTSPPGAAFTGEWNLTTAQVGCLLEGTMVSTPEGDRLVEALQAGDLVVTADGAQHPIRWIGRSVMTRADSDVLSLFPIRIRAGALSEAVPARDLLVSPDHAVFIDDVLVQAGALVNGVSIVQESWMPPRFTYFHVELAQHSLLVAEGAPVESFVDNVDRMTFDNWAEHEALFGTTDSVAEMDYPRAKSARQIPNTTRVRLLARQLTFGADQAAA